MEPGEYKKEKFNVIDNNRPPNDSGPQDIENFKIEDKENKDVILKSLLDGCGNIDTNKYIIIGLLDDQCILYDKEADGIMNVNLKSTNTASTGTSTTGPPSPLAAAATTGTSTSGPPSPVAATTSNSGPPSPVAAANKFSPRPLPDDTSAARAINTSPSPGSPKPTPYNQPNNIQEEVMMVYRY